MAILAFASASAASAATCSLEDWTSYKGTPLMRINGTAAYAFVSDWVAIDADGAPKAYHPDDVGKPCGSSGMGLDCPRHAGYPDSDWWQNVLVTDRDDPDRPHIQRSGPAKGYYLSMTALTDPSNPDPRDPAKWVDATEIPYLVFPEPFSRIGGVGSLGDLGVAYHTKTQRSSAFIIADIGPAQPLGEMSMALSRNLTGAMPNARNGHGIVAGDIVYAVFPGSAVLRSRSWPISAADIDKVGKQLLSSASAHGFAIECLRSKLPKARPRPKS